MIYDKLKNIGKYKFLNSLQEFDFKNYQKGKFDIDGDVFFGIGLEYDTKNEDECLWEAHQKYLDIHVIIEGQEIVNISDISNMDVSQKYNSEGDYSLFTGKKEQTIVLKERDFLILYPNEVHQTAVKLKNKTAVKKIVFKIKLTNYGV